MADPCENSDNEEEHYAGVPVVCWCLHLCLSVSKSLVMSENLEIMTLNGASLLCHVSFFFFLPPDMCRPPESV